MVHMPSQSYGQSSRIWACTLATIVLATPISVEAQGEYTIRPPLDEIVFRVAVAPNCGLFAATQADCILLYNAATGKPLRTISSKSESETLRGGARVNGLDFSPDGRLLAGGRWDGTIGIWQMQNVGEPVTLRGHKSWVQCVRFSPDGSLLASGSHDRTIILWDVKRRNVTISLVGHDNFVECVAFSPRGDLLASGSEDDTVKLWNLATGTEQRTLRGSRGAVKCIAFSSDGTILLSGNQSNEIHIWEVATGRHRGVLGGGKSKATGMTDTVTGLHVMRDGKTAISAGRGGEIRAWNLDRQEQIGYVAIKPRHSVESIAVSPDETYLLCPGSGMLQRNVDGRRGAYHAIDLIRVNRIVSGDSLDQRR